VNTNEIKNFECFLTDSFKEGNLYRELRLSAKEIEYIKKKYPRAALTRIEAPDHSDERDWYEVRFRA
jgi:hypothetical protein